MSIELNTTHNNKYGKKDLGTKHNTKSICAKFSPEIEEILLSFPNRSDYLRKAVLNQLRLDGYID